MSIYKNFLKLYIQKYCFFATFCCIFYNDRFSIALSFVGINCGTIKMNSSVCQCVDCFIDQCNSCQSNREYIFDQQTIDHRVNQIGNVYFRLIDD